MEIITATTDLMIVPEEKISLSAGVRLRPGVILTIGYGQNDDKDAPYRAVTLELDGDGPEASILVAFREPPPLKLFEGVAIGLPVFNENVQGDGEDDTEDDTIEDLLNLAANRAFTPKAEITIERDRFAKRDLVFVGLRMGDWEGRCAFEAATVAHLLEPQNRT